MATAVTSLHWKATPTSINPNDPDSGLLHWLHVVISNAKAFILGTYHGLPKKYLQSYLDEYSFRFSRRDLSPALIERLLVAVGTSARLS